MGSKPISRPPKLRDVARHAGVSMGTVSNVLNHPDKVTPATMSRVRHSIETLGFVRDANASSLAAGGSRSVGLVVIDLGNSIFVDVARGAQAAARKGGLNLLLAGSEDDFELQGANVDSFNEARVAGLLLAPMQDSAAQVKQFTSRGRPVVLVNYDSGTDDVCCVVVDNEQVGYLAARHLLDVGCTRIAFLGGNNPHQPIQLRSKGIRRAMKEARGRLRFEEVPSNDLTSDSAVRFATAIAARGPDTRPDGVITATDTLGAGLIEGLSDSNIRVPEDVSVIGLDDNKLAPSSSVPLSTMRMRGYEMGEASMRLLTDEMVHERHSHVHQRIVLEPELVPRASTMRERITRSIHESSTSEANIA
jgi:LacI family transcriptional regulator